MTPDLFEGTNATDQYTLDQTEGAEAKLQNHWDTYYTKDDFAAMKEWGLNAVRIPIGFWAYDNAGTPHLSGADVYVARSVCGFWSTVTGRRVRRTDSTTVDVLAKRCGRPMTISTGASACFRRWPPSTGL